VGLTFRDHPVIEFMQNENTGDGTTMLARRHREFSALTSESAVAKQVQFRRSWRILETICEKKNSPQATRTQ